MADAQDNITAFWSMIAPGYEAHPGNVPAYGTPLYRAWVQEIEALVPTPPTDALDLATGTGFVALILAALGHRVTAIDLSTDMLEQATATANSRSVEIQFTSGDAVQPAFDEASFDLVTCRHLLWTLREPDRALANWRGAAPPGRKPGRVRRILVRPRPRTTRRRARAVPPALHRRYSSGVALHAHRSCRLDHRCNGGSRVL